MKRLFSYFAVLTAATAILIGCAEEKKEKPAAPEKAAVEVASGDVVAPKLLGYECAVPNDAALVARFDANQVLVKSGLKAELTQMLRSQLQAEGAPEFVLELVNDFRNTGVDVEAPMYLFAKFVDSKNIFVSFVAKTYNKNVLDKLLNLASQGAIEKSVVSGCTVVPVEDGLVLAYNDTAVVLGGIIPVEESYVDYNVTPYLVEALQSAANGKGGAALPGYAGSDAAICLNMASLVDMIKPQILKEAASGYNSEVAYALEVLEQCRNAKVDLALNFANGSIDLDLKASNFPKVEGFQMPVCSNQNLDKVSANALLVANLPLNGSEWVKALTTLINENPQYKGMINDVLAESGVNGLNADMALSFITPLLNSVNGDLTLAINSVTPKYNDYASTADVDACAMVNVTDSSIINAIEMTGATNYPEIRNLSENNYVASSEGVNVYFGQKDKLLYASTPTVIAPKYPSATSASWYPAVQGSHAYVVLNISSWCSIPEFMQGVEMGINETVGNDELARQLAFKMVKSIDYLLLTAPTPESLSLQLVLKNKNENVLKQIVDLLKPLVYQNL